MAVETVTILRRLDGWYVRSDSICKMIGVAIRAYAPTYTEDEVVAELVRMDPNCAILVEEGGA